MALRSSPRLRALFQSDPSGKRAVFAPRLTRLASDRTARKESIAKVSPGRHGKSRSIAPGKSTEASKKSKAPRQTCRSRTRPSPRRVTQTTPTKRRTKNLKTEGTHIQPAETASEPSGGRRNGDTAVDSLADRVETVKRKRGRPPKAVQNCKRAKMESINKSIADTKSTPSTFERGPVVSNEHHDVIDLTCDDETLGDEETDAATFVPAPFASLELTHAHPAPARLRKETSELSDTFTVQEMKDSGEGNEVIEPLLHSDESLAMLFDLDKGGMRNGLDSSRDHIPSLKRSKKKSTLSLSSDRLEREHVSSALDSNSTESVSGLPPEPPNSPTEEEYPQPSTPQQKLVRRLARQKQLEEMRAREAALLREERLLRRRGILPSTARSKDSSTKKISWKDDQNLTEMFIYSPVKDDDDDTISISSDDAVAMETSLAVT